MSDDVVYQICGWAEMYEPDARTCRGDRALSFVMWRVHPHVRTGWFRRLGDRAGKENLLLCLGLFGKMLEMAGGEVRGSRDGTVYNEFHEPATAEDIAEENGLPLEQVRFGLAALAETDKTPWIRVIPRQEWLARVVDVALASHEAAGDQSGPAWTTVDQVGPRRSTVVQGGPRLSPKQEGEEERIGNGIRRLSKTQEDPDPPEDCDGQTESASDPRLCGGHEGVREALRARLLQRFGVQLPSQTDKTPRACQARGDDSTLWMINCAVVTAAGKDEANEQALGLIRLADRVMTRRPPNRLPAFVALAKEEFPVVAQIWPQNGRGNGAPGHARPAAALEDNK